MVKEVLSSSVALYSILFLGLLMLERYRTGLELFLIRRTQATHDCQREGKRGREKLPNIVGACLPLMTAPHVRLSRSHIRTMRAIT